MSNELDGAIKIINERIEWLDANLVELAEAAGQAMARQRALEVEHMRCSDAIRMLERIKESERKMPTPSKAESGGNVGKGC